MVMPLRSQTLRAFGKKPRLWIPLIGAIAVALLWLGQMGWSAPESIAPQALMAALETDGAPLVLDVRSPAEYAAGHIPGAVNFPHREIPDRLAELAAFNQAKVVVYCELGVRAAIAERTLEQAGFQQVLTLEGDMRGWRSAALPIASRDSPLAP